MRSFPLAFLALTSPSPSVAQAAPPVVETAPVETAPPVAVGMPPVPVVEAPRVPVAQTPQPPPAVARAPGPADERPRVAVSGYLQAQFTASSDGNGDGMVPGDTFLIRRMRIRFRGDVVKGVGYAVMVDPSTPSNLLRDGFMTLGFVPHHEIRIGQQKTQFGYENPESTTKLLTVNRALVSDALARGPDLRDVGLGVLGEWKLAHGLGIDYQLTVVNGSGPNIVQDDTPRKNFWGRGGASWTSAGSAGVRAGGSFATGNQLKKAPVTTPMMADTVYDFWRAGADVEVSTRWVFAALEFVQGANDLPTGEVLARGFYATLVGRTPWNLGPIGRLDEYDPDVDTDGDRRRRWTAGAYYDVLPVNVRFVVNYEKDASQKQADDALLLWSQVVFP